MNTYFIEDELPLYVRAHLKKLKTMNLTEAERQLLTRRIIEQTLKNKLNFSELSDEDDGRDDLAN